MNGIIDVGINFARALNKTTHTKKMTTIAYPITEPWTVSSLAVLAIWIGVTFVYSFR